MINLKCSANKFYIRSLDVENTFVFLWVDAFKTTEIIVASFLTERTFTFPRFCSSYSIDVESRDFKLFSYKERLEP